MLSLQLVTLLLYIKTKKQNREMCILSLLIEKSLHGFKFLRKMCIQQLYLKDYTTRWC